jgi:hypothetical protein
MMIFSSPQSLLSGMNRFLASLEITFRRDPTNYRPRVNKMNSVKDREQKCTLHLLFPPAAVHQAHVNEWHSAAGNYFFLEE